jgi:apolipoprotein N-acyltransferase
MSEASERPTDDGQTETAAGDRSGVQNLIRALDVQTQAKRGFLVGVLVAVGTYWFFVVASGGSPYSTPYLVALAAVLAFTFGLLATLAFTLVAAYRLSQRLE